MMQAVIIANGQLSANADLADLWQSADLRIAADGGSRSARTAFGLAPHTVIGDLDSLDDETRRWLGESSVEFNRHPVAKNETDLELAILLAFERGAGRVTVLGALGGRADQHIANVLLLARFPGVILRDAASEMWAARRVAAITGHAGDIVSLLPLDEQVDGVVTYDLLYPLKHETLLRGATRGVSNQMLTDSARVEWEKGLLLIVHLFGA